jgi:hypothetical protein
LHNCTKGQFLSPTALRAPNAASDFFGDTCKTLLYAEQEFDIIIGKEESQFKGNQDGYIVLQRIGENRL